MQQMNKKFWARFLPLLLVLGLLAACDLGGGADPSVSLSVSDNPTVGENVTLTAEADNFEDGATVSYAYAVTAPADSGITIDSTTSTATFTPTAEGSYTVEVTATSGEEDASDSETFTVAAAGGTDPDPDPDPDPEPTAGTVTLVADPTSVALAADGDAATTVTLTALASDFDEDVTYNFVVNDSEGNPVADGAVVAGEGDDANTATFTPAEAGTYSATVTAATGTEDDDVSATSEAVDITVVAAGETATPGDASVTLVADPTTVELGGDDDAVTLTTLTSNFGENPVYAYSVTTEPEGSAIDVNTESGESLTITPTVAGTYTIQASVTSDTVTTAVTDTVDITVEAEPDDNGGGTPTGEEPEITSFGASNTATGTFTSDGGADGDIENDADTRIVDVSVNDTTSGTFYLQLAATDDAGVTGATIQLRNAPSSADTTTATKGVAALTPGGDAVAGFSLGQPDCTFGAGQTDVTCTYEVTVAAGTPDIESFTDPTFAGEFAYVFRATVTDGTNTTSPSARAYVDLSAQGAGATSN